MLTDLDLRDNYSSDDSNILEDLFRPCLRESDTYYRSVGYLDSKMAALLGVEFESLAAKGGSARLLIGQTVTLDDYLAIKEGKLNPNRFLAVPDLEELWDDLGEDDLRKRGLLALSWLVAKQIVSVRFSIRPNGIHHDKFAYFRDSDANEVVVHGTNNETRAANVPEFNYESLSLFRNWEPEIFRRLGQYKLQEFLRLWSGRSKSALAIEAPNPLIEELAALSEKHRSSAKYSSLFSKLKEFQEKYEALPRIPEFWGTNRYALFDHQKKAIEAFYENDYRGIFAMATGSGKTITALHAITELVRAIAIDNSVDVFVVVAVPYQVLADQWVDNFQKFGYSPIRAYGSIDQWFNGLDHAVSVSKFSPSARVTAVVVVNRTLNSDPFQNLISQVQSEQLIFIGDECHRLGSSISRQNCPMASYRLGLSATPWAPNEEALRGHLLGYFGRPIANYGLSEAFQDKVLVRYQYILNEVALTEEEGEVYSEHAAEIKKLTAIKLDGGVINDDVLNFHYNQRAAILGSAENKFLKLPSVLSDVGARMGMQHLLVYCGSGSTEDDESATGSVRDIVRAQEIGATALGLQSARITAAESPNVRKAILRAFRAGSLAAVFAIKVLDEGFDMPGVRGAILLASSRNERQFIQRRGRVLRKAENKEEAYIWDFVVSGVGVMPDGYAKELAEMELLRCIEFARLSTVWVGLRPELELHAYDSGVDFERLLEKVLENRYEVNENE